MLTPFFKEGALVGYTTDRSYKAKDDTVLTTKRYLDLMKSGPSLANSENYNNHAMRNYFPSPPRPTPTQSQILNKSNNLNWLGTIAIHGPEPYKFMGKLTSMAPNPLNS